MVISSNPPAGADALARLAESALAELQAGAAPRFVLDLERALTALGNGARPEHATSMLALAAVQSARGDLGPAAAGFERVLASDGLTPTLRAEASAGLAFVLVRMGEWGRADTLAGEARELAARCGPDALYRTALAVSAVVPASRGELPLAMARIAEVEQADEGSVLRGATGGGASDGGADLLRRAAVLRARVCLAIGLNDWALLQRVLHEGEHKRVPVHLNRSEWFGLRVLAAWHLGQRERSDRLLRDWAEGGPIDGDPYYFAFSSVLHDRNGRVDDELRCIRRALELLGPGEDPLGRTWIRMVAGTAFSRHGGDYGPVEGLAVYKEARAELAALGASIFVVRCDSLIDRAAAGTTASLEHDPLRALSEQQRRVAALVVQGFTSPEIAPRLGVSRKTVDFHVANILARLGASNRREIGRILNAAAPDGM
ncbi:LuxR C-terminal-related transcriptional regulator [Herbiconiux sp. P18]|uniref:helix-turn-helix transcriptional regulator n=1 Tax=Herbiconiux liangxiaofengii TaxID=3342795 RepID=UPI0035B8BE70